MKSLYYVEFSEDDFDCSYAAAKQCALILGGQYLSSIGKTSLVPRIPCGFIFRSERNAREFEMRLKTVASTDEVRR